jgi:hypothetical protein
VVGQGQPGQLAGADSLVAALVGLLAGPGLGGGESFCRAGAALGAGPGLLGLVGEFLGQAPLPILIAGQPGASGQRPAKGQHDKGDEPGRRRPARGPPGQPFGPANRASEDGSAVEESPQVVGQGGGACVTAGRRAGQALQADGFQVAR